MTMKTTTSTITLLEKEPTLSPTSVVVVTSSCKSAANASSSTKSDVDHQDIVTTVRHQNIIDNDVENDDVDDLLSMGSPTSVAMVTSASSSSLLPSAATALSSTPVSPASACLTAKPFFVMDWLEEINPRDLALAQQMIRTPQKTRKDAQSTPVTSSNMSRKMLSRTASGSGAAMCKPSRSSIVLPTLNSNEGSIINSNNTTNGDKADDTGDVCRQLYPSEEKAPVSDDKNINTGATPGSLTNSYDSTGNMSSSTSATSVSTAVSPEATTPKTGRKTSAAVSPLSQASTTSSVTTTGSSNNNNTISTPMSPFKKRSIAIGNGYNAKGLAKAKKGCWESALSCWENALEIRTQVLGETHPDVANTCNNIGIALGKLERFDAAIEVLERALELRARHFGTREHVEIAATLHNIGNVLHAAQDCAGAIQCFWDAKLLQEQLLGPNHIQVARACVAIGNVYYEAKQHEDAREAYYDALQIFASASLPQTHPEVLAIQTDLQDIERLCARAARQQQQQHQYQEGYHHHAPTVHYLEYQHPQQQMGHYTPQGV